MSDTQKNKKPNVPNLRFPGFSGEWKVSTLKEECIVNPKTEGLEKEFLYIDLESVAKGRLVKQNIISRNDAPSRAQRVLSKWDIIYQCVRPYQLNNYIIRDESTIQRVASTGYAQIRTKHNPDFIYQLLHTKGFTDQVINRCTGTNYPAINSTDLSGIEINFPSIHEQAKIGKLLTLINQRIAIQSKVIEHYESLIRAFILRSQSSSSTRKVYLREILRERKELNEHGYDICSVSVSKGVVNQVEYLGRSFAAKETAHYHVVHKGDIVYTKSPTGEFPYGIIKQSYLDTPVAVSPLYGVYEPIDYLTGVYLHYYFCSPQNAKNYLHKLIQKGAKNTINISNQHFLDNLIYIPESDALLRIVALIEILSSKADLERDLLSIYSKQKTSLLSNLFI